VGKAEDPSGGTALGVVGTFTGDPSVGLLGMSMVIGGNPEEVLSVPREGAVTGTPTSLTPLFDREGGVFPGRRTSRPGVDRNSGVLPYPGEVGTVGVMPPVGVMSVLFPPVGIRFGKS
jgi:hypothetical protein